MTKSQALRLLNMQRDLYNAAIRLNNLITQELGLDCAETAGYCFDVPFDSIVGSLVAWAETTEEEHFPSGLAMSLQTLPGGAIRTRFAARSATVLCKHCHLPILKFGETWMTAARIVETAKIHTHEPEGGAR